MSYVRSSFLLAVLLLAARSPAQWIEEQQLLAPDGVLDDAFGAAVDISGDVIVVGVPRDDDHGEDSGAAWVFERTGGSWTPVAKLTAANGREGDQFGYAVAVDNGTILVGVPFDHHESLHDTGTVRVFRKIDGVWTGIRLLHPSDATGLDYFGFSLDIDGDTMLVGARSADLDPGAAYVIREIGGEWIELSKLQGSGDHFDAFGYSVALEDGLAAVGEPWANTRVGAVRLFEEAGGVWSPVVTLTASDGDVGDEMGRSVAISQGRVLAGASGHRHGVPGAGAAFVFERNGDVWAETAELLADNRERSDHFGTAVAVSGQTILVGAPFWDADQQNYGSGYVFENADGQWTQITQFLPHAFDERLGSSVAISGSTAVAGAPNWNDDTGAVYVYSYHDGCVADWNGDGALDTLDFLAYLNDWAAREPEADLNDDGVVDTLDFLAFLNAWAGGC